MARARRAGADRVHFWCPGCDDAHGVTTAFPAPMGPDWSWNGDLERPTFQPSVLVQYGKVGGVDKVCHSYVTDGRIQFLNDSTHALAGQTVGLPEWPHGGEG